MKYTLLLLLAVFALFGCQNPEEEVVLNDLDLQQTKLVVVGFLSPQDSVLVVKVSRSAPIGSSFTASILTNATVLLSEGASSVRLTYNSKEMYYEASARKLPIKSGATYTLTVTAADGHRVESRCTIPGPVPITAVRLDSAISNGQKQYTVRYQWEDVANQVDYYQTAGAFQYIKSSAAPTAWESVPVLFGTLTNPADLVRDDLARASKLESAAGLLSSETSTLSNGGPTTFSSAFRQAKLTAMLLHIDEVYYRYQRAVALAVVTNGNPFAEPVSVPSNITGGLGCFAGYNRATVRVTLR